MLARVPSYYSCIGVTLITEHHVTAAATTPPLAGPRPRLLGLSLGLGLGLGLRLGLLDV